MKKKQLKQKKLRPITITDYTLHTQITFFIGTKKEVEKSMIPHMEEESAINLKKNLNNPNVGGECDIVEFPDTGSSITIWMDSDIISDGIIAHEIYHGVCDNMKLKGIRVCEETEEIVAYLLMFYIHNIPPPLPMGVPKSDSHFLGHPSGAEAKISWRVIRRVEIF